MKIDQNWVDGLTDDQRKAEVEKRLTQIGQLKAEKPANWLKMCRDLMHEIDQLKGTYRPVYRQEAKESAGRKSLGRGRLTGQGRTGIVHSPEYWMDEDR